MSYYVLDSNLKLKFVRNLSVGWLQHLVRFGFTVQHLSDSTINILKNPCDHNEIGGCSSHINALEAVQEYIVPGSKITVVYPENDWTVVRTIFEKKGKKEIIGHMKPVWKTKETA